MRIWCTVCILLIFIWNQNIRYVQLITQMEQERKKQGFYRQNNKGSKNQGRATTAIIKETRGSVHQTAMLTKQRSQRRNKKFTSPTPSQISDVPINSKPNPCNVVVSKPNQNNMVVSKSVISKVIVAKPSDQNTSLQPISNTQKTVISSKRGTNNVVPKKSFVGVSSHNVTTSARAATSHVKADTNVHVAASKTNLSASMSHHDVPTSVRAATSLENGSLSLNFKDEFDAKTASLLVRLETLGTTVTQIPSEGTAERKITLQDEFSEQVVQETGQKLDKSALKPGRAMGESLGKKQLTKDKSEMQKSRKIALKSATAAVGELTQAKQSLHAEKVAPTSDQIPPLKEARRKSPRNKRTSDVSLQRPRESTCERQGEDGLHNGQAKRTRNTPQNSVSVIEMDLEPQLICLDKSADVTSHEYALVASTSEHRAETERNSNQDLVMLSSDSESETSKSCEPQNLQFTSNRRKTIVHLNAVQKSHLLTKFKESPFISSKEAKLLASRLGLQQIQVQNFFRRLGTKDQKQPNKKRSRKKYSAEEQRILRQAFLKSSNPSKPELLELATQLQTSYEQINHWFRNRRHFKDIDTLGAQGHLRKFSVVELRALHEAFEANATPSEAEIDALVASLPPDVTRTRLRAWFARQCNLTAERARDALPQQSKDVASCSNQTRATDYELLHATFAKTKHPSSKTCRLLAHQLQLSEAEVTQWFHTQRKASCASLDDHKAADFTREQLDELERHYAEYGSITSVSVTRLAKQLSLTYERVKHWFLMQKQLSFNPQ